MAQRVLVVDDEPAILELVSFNLRKEGYDVLTASDGNAALSVFRAEKPDLVILDLMIPDPDGYEVCRQIRAESSVPVIMLTARTEERDRVKGLDIGADDYVVKPFSPRELLARVRAVLRRSPTWQEEELLAAGDLVIDTERHEVKVAGVQVDLTPKEFDLLKILAESPGKVLERDFLLEKVWGYAFAGATRTLDVHIRRLRQKINDDPTNPRYIETVHGLGYKFKEQSTQDA
ncbi:MAG TPA: response regulator transcription factor [Firmicutes bacterium]|jgi:DNA-binding response OmpR family regulator|nr:response regulator transcription factor [Bacillota bacterium]